MEQHQHRINGLTERVIGCAIEVHRHLGPGLLESIYRECLAMELASHHVHFESERHVPIAYKGQRVRSTLKLDLLVEGCVVIELKAVEALHPIHLAQVMTYLKLTGYAIRTNSRRDYGLPSGRLDEARTAAISVSQTTIWFQLEKRGSTISKSLIPNDLNRYPNHR